MGGELGRQSLGAGRREWGEQEGEGRQADKEEHYRKAKVRVT